jgi:hypothetical protein
VSVAPGGPDVAVGGGRGVTVALGVGTGVRVAAGAGVRLVGLATVVGLLTVVGLVTAGTCAASPTTFRAGGVPALQAVNANNSATQPAQSHILYIL